MASVARSAPEPLPSELNTSSGSLAFLEVRRWDGERRLHAAGRAPKDHFQAALRPRPPTVTPVVWLRRVQVGKNRLAVKYSGSAQHDNDVGTIQVRAWRRVGGGGPVGRRRAAPGQRRGRGTLQAKR